MPTRVPWVVEAVHVRFGSELPAVCDWEAELWICVGEHNFPLHGPFWSSVVLYSSENLITRFNPITPPSHHRMLSLRVWQAGALCQSLHPQSQRMRC